MPSNLAEASKTHGLRILMCVYAPASVPSGCTSLYKPSVFVVVPGVRRSRHRCRDGSLGGRGAARGAYTTGDGLVAAGELRRWGLGLPLLLLSLLTTTALAGTASSPLIV